MKRLFTLAIIAVAFGLLATASVAGPRGTSQGANFCADGTRVVRLSECPKPPPITKPVKRPPKNK